MASAPEFLHGIDLLATGLLTGAIAYSQTIDRSRDPGLPRRLAALALPASLLWLAYAAGDMSGSWAPDELRQALVGTRFGLYGLAKLGVLAAILLLLRSRGVAAAFWLGLALPLFSGMTGHAGAQTEGRALSVGLDYAHFLAVGLWSGGLLSLAAALRAALRGGNEGAPGLLASVRAFSRVALGSVAVVAATGIAMAARSGVSWRRPWATEYGKLVLLKTFLFCLALSGAALNRFVHMREWKPGRERRAAEAILRAIYLEAAAVLLAFLAAGVLTDVPAPM